MLRERVQAAELVPADRIRVPDAATDAELLRVHTARYVRAVTDGTLSRADVPRIGFPWSPGLVERSRRSVGGTLAACRAALADGVAANLAGGTHHAFPDAGEGFCVFNDAAVAVRAVQAEGLARRVVLLDLDVHQGNGTAVIFRADPTVFTLSVHGRHNYPFRKERSDLDIALPDGYPDGPYLEAVDRGVSEALERGRPELAIYVAGADPHEGDRLGRLAVTAAGLEERDRLVFRRCAAAGVPVAVVMGGGYGTRVEDTVSVHFRTVARAAGLRRAPEALNRSVP